MKTTILVLSCFLSLVSCNPVEVQDAVSGNNLFASALYKQILNGKPQKNFIASPFSAEVVLALAQSGAKGETAEEMRNALRLPKSSDNVENSFKSLLPTIKSNGQYTLNTANKIYVKNGFTLNEDYRKIASDVYQSGIEAIDFVPDKEKAAKTMNQWVEDQTNDKIKNLINPGVLNEDTRLILINALHFKGNWSSKFDKSATSRQTFYKTEKDSVQVDFMHQTGTYQFHESTELNAKFLKLPFRGEDASLVVVLPNEKEGVAALEERLEDVFVEPQFSSENVNVQLPKFKIESETDFNAILKNLGMKKAFLRGQADLSGIAGEPGDLYISNVLQKAFIDLNEGGVEAAAATYVHHVQFLSGIRFKTQPKPFIADHPFIFYIKVKGAILFVGKIGEPVQKRVVFSSFI